MYIIKNAITSITRNKGRNILIGIIVLVISCATAVTLAIRNSATTLISSYENSIDIEATIGINRTSMRGEMKPNKNMDETTKEEQKQNMNDIFNVASNITKEDIENYGNSNYVKDYYWTISVGVNSDTLEKVSMEMSDNNNTPNNIFGGRENFKNMSSSDFTLMGYSSVSAMEEFISGKYSIVNGEVSTDLESNTCVVNSEFATLNDVEVNDEITFVDPDNEKNTVTLLVTGVYEEISDSNDMMAMFTSSANTIITNATVVDNFSSKNEDMKKTITPTFILKNKDVIDNFSEELTEKGLSEYLQVTTNLDMIENSTSTILNLKTYATTFLIITLIIGGIVLFVINMINIRERKYEIGVLRTIGMKKGYLTLQFVSELLIVSIISLLIGAGIGSFLSVPVSNSLLQSEITNATEERNNIGKNFGGPNMNFDKINGMVHVQEFQSIDAVVDFKVLLQLFGIGILLTLISSSAAVLSIQKFSPLTILKERS